MKKALITGITGQDGSYLAPFLLDKGYRVIGIAQRDYSVSQTDTERLDAIISRITLERADLQDPISLLHVLHKYKPDEIYHLAAQTDVRASFDMPVLTSSSIVQGTMLLLDFMKELNLPARFFHPSSSEMFGNSQDPDGFQRETTAMEPVSPYGCAKLHAHKLIQHYRRSYGLFLSNGISFNHESPRRGVNFVTNKVVKGAVKISRGLSSELLLGNLHAARDWGHSHDFVQAMWLMLQNDKPDDFVVATGVSHTVLELCEYVFGKLGLDYQAFVKTDSNLCRSEELRVLKGDSAKLRQVLGWKPTYTFESMLDEMIEYWMDRIPPLSSSTQRRGVAADIVLTETVSPSPRVARPWEVLIQPEKPISLDKLEIRIAGGDPCMLASRHPGLYRRSVEYWQQTDARVRAHRQEDLAEAFAQGHQQKALKLVSQIDGRQKHRLSRAFLQGTTLYLGINSVSYSDVLGTNDLAVHDREFRDMLVNAGLEDTADPDSYFGSPLSICAVLYGMESEGRTPGTEIYIPLGLRSDRVHHYPGSVHVFGCHVEKREDRSPDPFDYLMEALAEKLGLDRSSVGVPVFYGLIRQQPSRVPELVMGIPLRIGKPELEQRWRDAPARYEHEQLLFCTPEELGPFLERNITTMVPAGTAALSYYLQNCA